MGPVVRVRWGGYTCMISWPRIIQTYSSQESHLLGRVPQDYIAWDNSVFFYQQSCEKLLNHTVSLPVVHLLISLILTCNFGSETGSLKYIDG